MDLEESACISDGKGLLSLDGCGAERADSTWAAEAPQRSSSRVTLLARPLAWEGMKPPSRRRPPTNTPSL